MTVHPERIIARTERGGTIATEAPSNPWSGAGLLKPYAGGVVHEAPKVDALATISAGFKNDKGYPVVSRDGTIHVRSADRAPGLVAELERRGNKSLTIALVHNDPKDVLQQWFAAYSKTRLEARGDADEVTLIHLVNSGKRDSRGEPIMVPKRETVRRDENPTRYAQLVADMKVQTSLYFCLAAWTEDGEPRLVFPDGLGLYRLHFTSLNSAEAIKSQLAYIASLTGGRVAGVPLELSIAYRNLAGPDGVRREKVPIWSLVLKPPSTIELNPSRVASILESGIEQARSLAIAAPRPEPLEVAALEGPDVDLDEARIVDGEVVQPSARNQWDVPLANPERARTEFFLAVGRTSLRDREARSAFISAFTQGRTDSLATLIETTTAREWGRFLEAVADWVKQELEERQLRDEPAPIAADAAEAERSSRTYEQLFGNDDDPPPSAATRQPTRPVATSSKVDAAARLTGAPPRPTARPAEPEPMPAATEALSLPEEPDWLRSDERAPMMASYAAWGDALKRLDATYEVKEVSKLSSRALVAELRAMVGYARETYDAIYAAPPDDGLDAEDPDEQPPAVADARSSTPEPAPAF